MTIIEEVRAEVTEAYLAGLRAAWGDSNDEEIEAWRNAAEVAARALGVDTNALSDLLSEEQQ